MGCREGLGGALEQPVFKVILKRTQPRQDPKRHHDHDYPRVLIKLFRRRPLAEFDIDRARSFADYTIGVRGMPMRPRGVRWRPVVARHTETDI